MTTFFALNVAYVPVYNISKAQRKGKGIVRNSEVRSKDHDSMRFSPIPDHHDFDRYAPSDGSRLPHIHSRENPDIAAEYNSA